MATCGGREAENWRIFHQELPAGIPVVARRSAAEFLGGKLLCSVGTGWKGLGLFPVLIEPSALPDVSV